MTTHLQMYGQGAPGQVPSPQVSSFNMATMPAVLSESVATYSSDPNMRPRVVEQMLGPKLYMENPEMAGQPMAMAPGTQMMAPGTQIMGPGTQQLGPGTQTAPGTQIMGPGTQQLGPGTQTVPRLSMPVPMLERVPSMPQSPANGQYFAQIPGGVQRPQVQTVQTPRMAAYQVQAPSRAASVQVPVQIVPGSQMGSPMNPMMTMPANGNQMVTMPASVLTHIDSVVTEMERELSEIRAYEQRQEQCEVRQSHLNEIRRLVADRLLNNGDEEEELRQVRAEVSRLSVLETDHFAVKRQVQELEQQRSTAEREREELLRIRAALEVECETRLNELRAAAEAVETEKRRAQQAEESANERVVQAAYEARSLQEQLIEVEAIAERERLHGVEAFEAHATSEADLKALEGNSRAVLNDCRALQSKIQSLESERTQITVRVTELETECDGWRVVDEGQKVKIDELERQLEDHHSHHNHRMSIHVEKIETLEGMSEHHQGTVGELERLLGEKGIEAERHAANNRRSSLRLTDLEKALADAQEREGDHHKQHASNRGSISAMEQELVVVRSEKDNNSRGHKSRVGELELMLEELRASHDTHQRQSNTHRTRVQELEQLLQDLQGADGNHQRTHATNRSRIQELEQLLIELQGAHDTHARQSLENKRRSTTLQQELEVGRFSDGEMSRKERVHKAALEALEEQLREALEARDKHMKEKSEHRSKISELESLLDGNRISEDAHQRTLTTNKQRIEELERQLDELRAEQRGKQRKSMAELQDMELALCNAQNDHGSKQKGNAERISELEMLLETRIQSELFHKGEHEKYRNRISELERTEQVAADLETRMALLMQQLVTAREERTIVQNDLEGAREANEQMARDADFALRSADDLQRKQKMELEEKLKQANQTILELKESLDKQHADKVAKRESKRMSRVSTTSVTSQRDTSMSARRSLWGEIAPTRDFIVGNLLPNSTHPFVGKVRNAVTVTVADALKASNEAHVKCIQCQLKSSVEARDSGGDVRSGLTNFAEKVEVDSERTAAAEQVQAAIHELRALNEEQKTEHDMSEYENQELTSRIEVDLSKCEDDFNLLRSESALTELPETTLNMLLSIQDNGGAVSADWNDGFSPMHWAAKNGRRDIMEYLLRLEGGKELLSTRDKFGRAPLYYAQQTRRPGLEHWLTQEVGGAGTESMRIAPVIAQEPRPSMTSMPEPYLKVLNQIETYGWRSMNWRDGFTMLHWSAQKGHTDVSKYLIQLDADVLARDEKGRTPVDLAKENGNDELVSVLQGLAAKGRRSISFK